LLAVAAVVDRQPAAKVLLVAVAQAATLTSLALIWQRVL
jgi:hypothetical protein